MKKLKIYLVYSNPCCEDDNVCSCHSNAKDLVGIYFSKAKALKISEQCYLGSVEEEEVR